MSTATRAPSAHHPAPPQTDGGPADREPVSPAATGMFSSLRTRNYRIYFAGQLISNCGGWTQRVAQDWLVLTLTHSPTAVGITTALQFAPTIAFGTFGGAIADRIPKRRILTATVSVMMAVAAALAVLVITGRIAPWQIFLAATVLGFATALDNPARQAFVNEMVGPDLLRNAISLNSAVFQLGALAGPALAAVLISTVGTGWAFVVNAVSFGAAIAALRAIRTAELVSTGQRDHQRQGLSGLAEVVRQVWRRPELRWPVLLIGICGVFTGNFPVTLSAMAQDSGAGASRYGLLTCLLALGSLVGALFSATRGSSRLRTVLALTIAFGVVSVLAAAAPGGLGFAVMLVGLGGCAMMTGIAANSTVQLAAGDAVRGRVMSVYLLFSLGGACLGGPVIGALVEHSGPRAALLLGGLVPGVAAALIAVHMARGTGFRALPRLALPQRAR